MSIPCSDFCVWKCHGFSLQRGTHRIVDFTKCKCGKIHCFLFKKMDTAAMIKKAPTIKEEMRNSIELINQIPAARIRIPTNNMRMDKENFFMLVPPEYWLLALPLASNCTDSQNAEDRSNLKRPRRKQTAFYKTPYNFLTIKPIYDILYHKFYFWGIFAARTKYKEIFLFYRSISLYKKPIL